ncbi:MAG TPA: trypsin-like peptidase domain-containing protein [Burkholderiaceae bacterium]|nr:trypsin-like peptidase domain-containing protein [Burkholderiaceae bacterium]
MVFTPAHIDADRARSRAATSLPRFRVLAFAAFVSFTFLSGCNKVADPAEQKAAVVAPPLKPIEQEASRLMQRANSLDAAGRLSAATRLLDLARELRGDLEEEDPWHKGKAWGREAEALLETLANEGNAEATAILAEQHYHGLASGKVDKERARVLNDKALAAGSARAIANKAWWLVYAAKNDAGCALAIQAAERSDRRGLLLRGLCLGFGWSGRVDVDKASDALLRAMDMGDPGAPAALGLIHAAAGKEPHGGMSTVALFETAAKRGSLRGMVELGKAYWNGAYGKQDYALVRRWLERAARSGDSEGRRWLGLMNEQGLAGPVNTVEAYFWLNLAMDDASASERTAIAKDRERVAKSLTSEQIQSAQELARNWTAQSSVAPLAKYAARSGSAATELAGVVRGTAVWIAGDGTAVTNAHVVSGCKKLTIGQTPAKVVAADKTNDLAILKREGEAPVESVRFRASDPVLGEEAGVFGFAYSDVLAPTGNFTKGTVSATSGLENNAATFQHSAAVQPGMSGGPILDDKGRAIGIVVSKLDALQVARATGDVPQNVNFGIKASTVFAFLRSNGVEPSAGGLALLPVSSSDIAARAKNVSALVECSP